MLRTFTVGRLFDIRVGVDVTWIAVFAFMTCSIAGSLTDVPAAATYAISAGCALCLFASVIAHEFAHALVARRFGVRTRAITLFLFGGVATLECEPPTPRAEICIALAGPAMSAAIGALAFGGLRLLEPAVRGDIGDALLAAVAYLALANAMLAAFNLVPAFPMDGGRVLRATIWKARRSHAAATGAASIVGLALAGALAAAGLVATIGGHGWQYLWYTAMGGFLMRQGWVQFRESRRGERFERLERVCVTDVMDAASSDEFPGDEISLTSSASALDAASIFRSSERTQIAVVDAGHLAGWLRRDRVLRFIDNAA
jgi:Zn-dependent protease